jgi:DEAD/DEAH box helicase domain-containing protein
MIACFECRNLVDFTQVSTRGDSRSVLQTRAGTKLEPFVQLDDRECGVYCSRCGAEVPCDLDIEDLLDKRLASVAPLDFDVASVAAELQALRPDASWSQLELPAQEPMFGDLPANLHPSVVAALHRARRLPLYSHQTEAIELGLSGRNVVLATPAGSGKSIGLLAPVLDRLVRDPDATAIVIFPLKALANDQMNALVRRFDQGARTASRPIEGTFAHSNAGHVARGHPAKRSRRQG